MARCGGENDFLHHGLGLLRMLFEIIFQGFGHGSLYGADHFVVAEFGLGLSLELGFHHLHRHYSRQTLAEVRRVYVHLLFDQFVEHLVFLGILFEGGSQSAAESCQVCAALDGVDVVDE